MKEDDFQIIKCTEMRMIRWMCSVSLNNRPWEDEITHDKPRERMGFQ